MILFVQIGPKIEKEQNRSNLKKENRFKRERDDQKNNSTVDNGLNVKKNLMSGVMGRRWRKKNDQARAQKALCRQTCTEKKIKNLNLIFSLQCLSDVKAVTQNNIPIVCETME